MGKHAYINIEPNNGGIVLNVSDGGLCFHSFDKVQPNGTIRFWFSENNQRIEATGAVTWTDETQKGGLRFTDLPVEARDKIRNWISQPEIPVPKPEGAVSAGPRPRASVLSASPTAETVPTSFLPPAMLSSALQTRRPMSAFSKGLATGLLVSAVVASAFLFNSYRRELGESLIQLGERFAAKPQAETVVVSAAVPEGSAPAPTTALAAAPVTETPKSEPSPTPASAISAPPTELPKRAPDPPQPEKLAASPTPVTTKPQPAAVDPAKPAVTSLSTVANSAPKPSVMAAAPAMSLPSPTTSLAKAAPTILPVAAMASNANVNMPKINAVSKVEAAKPPGLQTEDAGADNIDLTRELYFDVGKFKNQLQAHDETDKLAQLGLPVTAVQKGFLWTNSYHVLVGPYGDEGKAKVTQDTLVSSGFKPRPFEKGWRTFKLISSVTLNGAPTPQGEYTISWESYIGNASVKFTRNSNVVASADGKWLKRDVKYPRDEYVYRRNPDGSRTLLEIHFEGMRQALVFGKAS
jgi:PilZ domain-containing protein/sporulation related protein